MEINPFIIMKALIFSDLHVHDYKQFNKDGTRARKAADMIRYVFKLADANHIKHIWFCGDMGDQFTTTSVIAMNEMLAAFKECFISYPVIDFIAIPGNHDFATKNTFENVGISIMDTFGPSTHFRGLFDKFYLLNHMDGYTYSYNHGFSVVGVPFFEDADDFWAFLERALKDVKYPEHMYLLMHQMVWPENPIVQDDINYLDPRLKDFKWIFNGHVHHGSMIGNNFINVGSPMHRDASDVGTKKGIWLLDSDEDLPGFFETTDRNPQYIKKAYGEQLTEWEEQQYVVWYHPEDKKKKKDRVFDASKFDSQKVKPIELVQNFLNEQPKLDHPEDELLGVAVKYFE